MRSFFEFAGKTPALLVAFVATAAFLLVVFPILPLDGELLDVKPGYSHEEVMNSMEEYGAEGRTIHLWSSTVLDTIFVLVYITLFAGLIYRFRISDRTWWLAFVPVLAGMWDILENIQITAMLALYPDIRETQVSWSSTFTVVKLVVAPIYHVIGLGFLLVAVFRRVFSKFLRKGD